jgi:hypothetical protein
VRSKAFFINGGAGRVLCSIPALEKYAETHPDALAAFPPYVAAQMFPLPPLNTPKTV